ncbi:hypothetical protein G8A07_25410 [Roseateles sp. DAIF2]|uniref:hypothetical protein n=1 Tax=Roseateles sp. DAIF2 TaxID=2714952 RepID=UPI0018A32441|nr:hypothetical protein [Roseateles sp. DAIF2]QPF75925.1 hypothetical protein G8A07_25410 [Roseateles sp. DAIF2]
MAAKTQAPGQRCKGWGQGLLAILLLWQGAALAQQQQAVNNEEGKELLACLQRPQAPPDYPEFDKKALRDGTLRVRLSFTAADKAPAVQLLFRAGSERIVESVERHVAAYRLPCLPAGQRVDVVQEFNFAARGGDAVHWSAPRHVPSTPHKDWHACIRTPARQLRVWEDSLTGTRFKPREFGNVVVQMRFDSPTAPPQVKVVYAKADDRVRNAVLDHVAEYRMPCLPDGAEPQVSEQLFKFRSHTADDPVYTFKDMDLTSFLARMTDLERRPVRFDLDSMGCPFKLMWTLGRPALPNRVGEIGEPNLNRLELTTWLSELTMGMPPTLFDQMLGQSLVVTVPCGKVELG